MVGVTKKRVTLSKTVLWPRWGLAFHDTSWQSLQKEGRTCVKIADSDIRTKSVWVYFKCMEDGKWMNVLARGFHSNAWAIWCNNNVAYSANQQRYVVLKNTH